MRNICSFSSDTKKTMIFRKGIVPIHRSTRDEKYPGISVGLQRTNSSAVIPLRDVSAEAWIHSFAADVILTQVYEHSETNSIEAIYIFPIEVWLKLI